MGVIGGEGAGGRKAEGADEEEKVQVVVRGQSQMMGEAIVVGKDEGDDAVMKIARLKTGRCVKSLVV